MAKIDKKLLTNIIIAVSILIIADIAGYLILLHRQNESIDYTNSPAQSDTYYFSDELPSKLKTELENIASANGLIETDNSEIATIAAFTGNSASNNIDSLSIYQIWIITKPWSKLADNNVQAIGTISPKIDLDETGIASVVGERFEISEGSGLLEINTLQELDSSRISVDIDTKSPFDKSWWQNQNYPLILKINIFGPADMLEIFQAALQDSNFLVANDYMLQLPSADDFVNIVHTGTSVAGGPGWQLCESTSGRQDYPIDNVKNLLTSADLTIISNESSFVEGCTQAAGTTAFCGKPAYFQNLLDLGTDIISLTGNHMCDYGRGAFSETMARYSESNIKFFGSGSNETEAWQPLYVETAAGRIAFIGFNNMGPGGVLATDGLAGTAYYDQGLLANAVNEAKQNADIIWIDNQLWPEYGTEPGNDQLTLNREAIDDGADIVTGVGSHEIQSMEFYNGKPIFFGLGNFLFDQMLNQETRQGIVLNAYIYDKKIRNIEIYPTMMYDYCQPRFSVGEEKILLQQYLVDISGF